MFIGNKAASKVNQPIEKAIVTSPSTNSAPLMA